ncbi:MAG: hypothetical protein NPIRA05_13160 [Nitrospirales bacterium]|nr:MAG: hypothetical protein NPIRA05_13160 [Nitrospirales bacterium]
MPAHILVLDDDQDIALMLKDRLNFLGYYATTANNGVEGLAMLETMAIDGILLDVQMPIMDGLTMLKYLQDQHPQVPVIMMTAEFNKNSLMQAMQRGARDYLLKPIDSECFTQKCSTVFIPRKAKVNKDDYASIQRIT